MPASARADFLCRVLSLDRFLDLFTFPPLLIHIKNTDPNPLFHQKQLKGGKTIQNEPIIFRPNKIPPPSVSNFANRRKHSDSVAFTRCHASQNCSPHP